MKRKVPWAGAGEAAPAVPRQVLRLAARVLRSATRERPADRVLREALRSALGMPAQERTAVSQAVFACDRWRGWTRPGASVESKLADALEWRRRFMDNPGQIGDGELVARAVPSWVGEFLEVTPAWARSLQEEPRLWLRARPGRARALVEQLGAARPAGLPLLPDALEYLGQDDLFQTRAFHHGEFELQDLASQAVGCCCAPKPGQTWWDACAGEGGKTLHLADLMENKGLVVATDRAEWRLRQLKRRAARARLYNYRTKLWARDGHRPIRTPADGVLVDAPCSGLGTWGRNPQARWTCRPEDVRELSEVQWRLLGLAAALVKPRGKLVYSVCTMTRPETSALADRFTAEFPQFKPMAMPHPFQADRVMEGRMTLWPHEAGGNGMFIAAWTREGAR